MRRLNASDMTALPEQIRSLIVDGVYALYSVEGEPNLFALVTDKKEFYLLSIDGEIVHHERYRSVSATPLGGVVTLAEPPNFHSNRI